MLRRFAEVGLGVWVELADQLAVAAADLRFAGESFDDAANTVALDGYEVLDLRAALPLGETLEVYGRVENVFDTDYQTVAGYGTAGRSVFGGIRATM